MAEMAEMANKDFYQQKVKNFIHFADPENGRFKKAKLAAGVDDLCAVLGTPSGEKAICKRQFTKWCDMLLPEKEQEGVSAEEYADLCWDMLSDPVRRERYKLENVDTYSCLFDVLDTNKDRLISREELALYYKTCGCEDKQFVEKVFRQLDENEDGYVTKEEFTKAGLTYWYNTDPASGYEYLYMPPADHGKKT